MSLTFPDASVKKPSAITPKPSSLIRPAFGVVYGFDASGLGNVSDAILTEAGSFLLSEAGGALELDTPPFLATEALETLITEASEQIQTQ
ncbi:MAG: hypothetical protein CMI27_05975 [Opitutae bacterium]|nr:hypothetical protein [Opitutae bacterium]|tara:strand:+ start:10229 stop:10498 length:270 start_codon:yes stop_codon:yes gene_type:complete